MSKKIVLLVIIVIFIIVAMSIFSVSKTNPYVGVDVDKIGRADVKVRIHAPGKIEMKKSKTLSLTTPFKVTDVHATVGQLIKKDDKLLTLKNYGDLKAPFDGTVLSITVNVDDTITPGAPIVTIGDLSEFIVNMDIHEYDAPLLKLGQPVSVYSNAFPGEEFLGSVMLIDPIATTQQSSSGLETIVVAKAHLTTGLDDFIPGNNVDCQIVVDERNNVVVVPVASIIKDADGKDFVYLVDENNALVKRIITLGYYSNFSVEVSSGVEEGDVIVLSPKEEYSEGMIVAPLYQNQDLDSTSDEKPKTNDY